MKPKHKKIGLVLLVVVLILIAIPFIANLFIKKKVEKAIEDLPKSVQLNYDDLEVSFMGGSLEFLSPSITITGKISEKIIIDAQLGSLKVFGFSYWKYLTDDIILLKLIQLDSLVLAYKHNDKVDNESYNPKINHSILVENINVLNTDLLVTEFSTDSTMLSIPVLNFKLNDFKMNSKTTIQKIPFDYESFNLEGEHLKWSMSAFENIDVNNFKITKTSASFQSVDLKTKYAKAQLSEMIENERDHFNVNINRVKLNGIDYGFNDENLFYFEVDSTNLLEPIAEIYRDKLVTDDKTEKSLYSKMLRELDFNFGLKTVEIDSGLITYSEKVRHSETAGTLDFRDFNATIKNLGNTFGNNDTTIDVEAEFMEHSPLHVNWNFKSTDQTDQFVFKADLGYLNAAQLDQFTEPNLNVDLDGKIIQTYFTINGDPETSNIDLKIKYEAFKISILEDAGNKKKGFASGLVNLFVSKNSEHRPGNFRYGYANNIERDKTKSIFNFIWLNIKEGLKSAMTGNGKKTKI